MDEAKRTPISVRLDEEDESWVKGRASKADLTPSKWIRAAVEQARRAIGPLETPLRPWESKNGIGTAPKPQEPSTSGSGSAGTSPSAPAASVYHRAVCDCTGAQLKSTAHQRHLKEARWG